LEEIISSHKAGCPVSDQRWTYLTAKELVLLLAKKGIKVCKKVVKRLLKKLGIGRRKLFKNKVMKKVEHRNDQFEIINKYKNEYLSNGCAVLSIDTKKKELRKK